MATPIGDSESISVAENDQKKLNNPNTTEYWIIDGIPRGYCLIINNLKSDESDSSCVDVSHLEELLRNKFNFLVVKWSHMNHSTLKVILKCLTKMQFECLMVVFLGSSSSVVDRRFLSIKNVQSEVSKTSLSLPNLLPTLLLCHVHGLEVNNSMFSVDSVENLYQLIYKHSSVVIQDDERVGRICVLSKFFKEAIATEGNLIAHVEDIASQLRNEGLLYYIQSSEMVQERRLSLPSCPDQSLYLCQNYMEIGGYTPGVKYKEFDMTCKIWKEIRTNTINTIAKQQLTINELSYSNRRKRLACAFNSMVTGILTVGVFVALLFVEAQSHYPQILLVIFGFVLQLVNIFGNIYSVYCVVKKYRTFKREINIAKELAEIDLTHWKIVEEARSRFESNENTNQKVSSILQGISVRAIETLKTIFTISSFTIYSTRIAASIAIVWRSFSVGMRVIVVAALVGSLICIPLDIIEIAVLMKNLSKPSKIGGHFKKIVNDLKADQKEVLKELKKSKQELYNEAMQKRDGEAAKPQGTSRSISHLTPIASDLEHIDPY